MVSQAKNPQERQNFLQNPMHSMLDGMKIMRGKKWNKWDQTGSWRMNATLQKCNPAVMLALSPVVYSSPVQTHFKMVMVQHGGNGNTYTRQYPAQCLVCTCKENITMKTALTLLHQAYGDHGCLQGRTRFRHRS